MTDWNGHYGRVRDKLEDTLKSKGYAAKLVELETARERMCACNPDSPDHAKFVEEYRRVSREFWGRDNNNQGDVK